MKNAVFRAVTPCGSCKNVTRATRPTIPEDGILQKSRVQLILSVYIMKSTGFSVYERSINAISR
jgi:hypothetical protein